MANTQIKITDLPKATVANGNTLFLIVDSHLGSNVTSSIDLDTLNINLVAYQAWATANQALSTGWNANIAFNKSNSAFGQANAAFTTGNSSFSQANVAFAQANLSFNTANAAYLGANASIKFVTTSNSSVIAIGGNANNIIIQPVVSGITPGIYGDSTYVPQLTIDAYGRVSAVGNSSLSSYATQAWVLGKGYIDSVNLTPYVPYVYANTYLAPLASPSLTGTPVCPTPPFSEDPLGSGRKKIVNVEYVRNFMPTGVGYSQSWVSVTRTAGVTYTNNTDKPIMVNVMWGGGPGAVGTLTVGGVLVARMYGTNSGGDSDTHYSSGSAVVPIGTTYVITGSIIGVAELR